VRGKNIERKKLQDDWSGVGHAIERASDPLGTEGRGGRTGVLRSGGPAGEVVRVHLPLPHHRRRHRVVTPAPRRSGMWGGATEGLGCRDKNTTKNNGAGDGKTGRRSCHTVSHGNRRTKQMHGLYVEWRMANGEFSERIPRADCNGNHLKYSPRM